MTTTLDSFAALLSRRRIEASHVYFDVADDWTQGRTIFGGLLSALAVQSMRDVCGADWPLRALQTSFVGPVNPGCIEVQVQLLRQGKNVRQVQAVIRQSGSSETAGVLLAVFGAGRESSLPRLMPDMPSVAKSREEGLTLPFLPGLTPNFTQHFEFTLVEGAYPFMGADTWHSRVFTRITQADSVDSELLTIMLADAGPTPPLSRLKAPAPASSVSWALELRPVAGSDCSSFWRVDKDALAVAEGYVNERTSLWTPDGQLAALGYQVVAVYA